MPLKSDNLWWAFEQVWALPPPQPSALNQRSTLWLKCSAKAANITNCHYVRVRARSDNHLAEHHQQATMSFIHSRIFTEDWYYAWVGVGLCGFLMWRPDQLMIIATTAIGEARKCKDRTRSDASRKVESTTSRRREWLRNGIIRFVAFSCGNVIRRNY